jgi:hypothetical protein
MALAVMAVLDVGSSTAEAAPSVSPFAGSYVGYFGGTRSWSVTISDGGLISGGAGSGGGRTSSGSMRGKVRADGRYSLEVTKSGGREGTYLKYKTTGTMALDAAGDIVGEDDRVGSFVWFRQ